MMEKKGIDIECENLFPIIIILNIQWWNMYVLPIQFIYPDISLIISHIKNVYDSK